jgi:hypothetical protein
MQGEFFQPISVFSRKNYLFYHIIWRTLDLMRHTFTQTQIIIRESWKERQNIVIESLIDGRGP